LTFLTIAEATSAAKPTRHLPPFPWRTPVHPIIGQRPIDPFGKLDIHRIDEDPPDEEADGEEHGCGDGKGKPTRTMAPQQHGSTIRAMIVVTWTNTTSGPESA
jgi:hypothetical protein